MSKKYSKKGIKCTYCDTFCKSEESLQNWHLKRSCKNYPKTNNPQTSCSFCGKICKNANSWRNHERLCKLNPKREESGWLQPGGKRPLESIIKTQNTKKERGTFSNGSIKAKQEGRVYEINEDTRQKLREASSKQVWTEERRDNHRSAMITAVLNNPDSYTASNIAGRVKRFKYKNTVVQGSWELLVAELLDAANIVWTNKIPPFEYIWEERKRLYFPDFYLPDYNLYIEVKGFKRDRDDAKWAVVPNLVVFMENEINFLKEGNCISELFPK